MTQISKPIRFDHIGSYLRPDYLLEARNNYKNGKIEKEELKEIEDRAIIDLIKKQEESGLRQVTDGEFRRYSWHCDFFWGFEGVDQVLDEANGSKFEGKVYGITARLGGKIRYETHPFLDHWKFVNDNISPGFEAKLTIPAPSQMVQELLRDINIEKTKDHYDSLDELIEDTIQAYGAFLEDYYKIGGRTIQFDDCTWSRLISGKDHSGKEFSQEEIDKRKDLYISLNNGVIENAPQGLTINSHICRGNFASTWFASGGYESVTDPLFTEEKVGSFYLEYDTERAGSFEPLELIPDSKRVVLGLVTTKDGKLEDKEELKSRIHQASQYAPLENLAISPQCGFSSNEIGNKIQEEDQWKKIALIRQVAEEVWQD